VVWSLGPEKQNSILNHIRSYLIKQNFMNYLLLFIIAAFKIKIARYVVKKGFFSSESKSAILLLVLLGIPILMYTTLYVHKVSSSFETSWSTLRTSLQILFPNNGWLVSKHSLSKKTKSGNDIRDSDIYSKSHKRKDYNQTPINMPLFFICMFNIYILSPAFLKFSKMLNMVMQTIRKDEEKLERLSGNPEINSKAIKNISDVHNKNKLRRKWFLITLIFEMIWLLLLSFDKVSGLGFNLLNQQEEIDN